ncbi:MAG: TonB-dependent receptor [bacterium]
MIGTKFKILILAASLHSIGSAVWSQSSLTDALITLRCQNQPLRSVLREIERQTNARFVFQDALVDGRTITCQINNTPIQEALLRISQQIKLSFLFQSDGTIVLFKKATPKPILNTIQGRVTDASSKKSLSSANVFLSGTTIGASTDKNGEFIISNIADGIYDLKCMFIGYKTVSIDDIILSENARLYHDIEMDIQPIPLKKIIVTPSHYTALETTPVSSQTLNHRDIETIPHLGNDIYRVVGRLPGISMKDFSSRFTVRGGEHNQILVLVDGLELYEPFHQKYILGGASSIIDAAAIESIDLMTGAFTAEYGDRMSGVFNIKSREPKDNQRNLSLGVSNMHVRLVSEGAFNQSRGSWLLSARRGYLNLGFQDSETTQDKPSSYYYDILGKLQYRLNEKQNLHITMLHANDRLLNIQNEGGTIDNGYGNSYGWFKLESIIHPKLHIQTIASTGRVYHHRLAFRHNNENQNAYYSISDMRDFRFYGLKQDWSAEPTDRYNIKWGVDLKWLVANYDYSSLSQNRTSDDTQSKIKYDTTRVVIIPSGQKLGAYLTNRFRLGTPLTMEIGFRYDYTSYTNDRLFSPRFNLIYMLGRRTSIRGGWGKFYQSQGIHEFQAPDGENAFFSAECAEHRVISFDHIFENGIHVRLEGYYKKLSNLRPVYGNWQQFVDIFPEMSSDRFRIFLDGSTAKGVEIYLKKESGRKVTWWTSYALKYISDYVEKIINRDEEIPYHRKLPGVFDQRHTVYFDINYRPTSNWQFHIAWQYSTGCPFTEWAPYDPFISTSMGEFNNNRYPPYHRMDLRVNRHINTQKGRITAYVEIINLYNRKNVAYYQYAIDYQQDSQSQVTITKKPRHWLPLLPSVGIVWSWGK